MEHLAGRSYNRQKRMIPLGLLSLALSDVALDSFVTRRCRKDHAGLRAVREEFSCRIREPSLGGSETPPRMHDLALATHESSLLEDGADEVHLQFDGGVGLAGLQHGVDGAAHG